MKSQRGFTFTELLAVATVMAMLAAVAVPRYAMLNSESRADSVRALAANIKGSSGLANRIWRAAGRPAALTLDGREVEMRHGYPTAQSIERLVVVGDFVAGDGYFRHADTAAGESCAVLYIPPPDQASAASIVSYTDGC
jgi:prepilin-type N-terminal cleavage/methylation domain-containing protein